MTTIETRIILKLNERSACLFFSALQLSHSSWWRIDIEREIYRQAAKSASTRQAFETHIVHGAHIQFVCHLCQHRSVNIGHRSIHVWSNEGLGKHPIKREHGQKANRRSFAILAASTLFLALVASNRNQSSACHTWPLESCHTNSASQFKTESLCKYSRYFAGWLQIYCRILGLQRHCDIFSKRSSTSCCIIRSQIFLYQCYWDSRDYHEEHVPSGTS